MVRGNLRYIALPVKIHFNKLKQTFKKYCAADFSFAQLAKGKKSRP
jgi:hypothetical protein